jgi:hypothetical protein
MLTALPGASAALGPLSAYTQTLPPPLAACTPPPPPPSAAAAAAAPGGVRLPAPAAAAAAAAAAAVSGWCACGRCLRVSKPMLAAADSSLSSHCACTAGPSSGASCCAVLGPSDSARGTPNWTSANSTCVCVHVCCAPPRHPPPPPHTHTHHPRAWGEHSAGVNGPRATLRQADTCRAHACAHVRLDVARRQLSHALGRRLQRRDPARAADEAAGRPEHGVGQPLRARVVPAVWVRPCVRRVRLCAPRVRA